ncbi:lauroyl acyltransferase [Nibribacter ruber]|uniref:Lauroyl acyltransferase n=1 Tax=Nibribacter ruber TaxID=2698458 RepID=A0A6P1NY85_9BACT|nr:lysophospholipid acyltransferase family protein [Nibribacter ruber]QHL87179.1 lauroyl acyltransferase [Nibribacter ruber]
MKGISLLPFWVLYGFSTFLYGVLYKLIGYRKKVVRQNIERSFPARTQQEHRQIEKQFYQNLCDVIVETLKMVSISPAELQKRVTFKGNEKAEAYLQQGHQIIAMGAHLANWEIMSAAGNLRFDFPIDGVYKPLSSSFFEAFMVFLRSRFGIQLIPMKDTLRHMIRHKNQPRLFTMLADQVPPYGHIQYWTTFLHQDTAFYVSGDKLRESFGYPVFFVGMKHQRRGYFEIEFIELFPPLQEKIESKQHPVTHTFARQLEQWIEANPSDYLWSHKRWKHKKPAEQAHSPES